MKWLFALLCCLPTSIYDLSFTTLQTSSVKLYTYQSKKMLFVNIASSSPLVGQLAELQQLQHLFGDSVQVIAFPSNSFGHEPLNDEQIAQQCYEQYSATFPVTKRTDVLGAGTHPIYQWLADAQANGVFSWTPSNDFCKVLISEHGQIVGQFAAGVHPMDSLIINAIMTDY